MIRIKSDSDLELMRVSARMVAETFEHLAGMIAPGISTGDIDAEVESFITARGGYPAFKGMYGFPASACISVDAEVVHGIPSRERVLTDGQIVTVDIGVRYEGFYGDAAYTFPVGTVAPETLHLMQTTWESLFKGIAQARSGQRLSDISHAIQRHAEGEGFSVVRELVGHGIGRDLHEDPQVPNFGPPGKGPKLRPGITLAIEPMINAGGPEVITMPDEWTIVTSDRRPSAHYEHTVLIRDGEAEILTQHSLSPTG